MNILERKFIFSIIAEIYIIRHNKVKKYKKSMLPLLKELLYTDEHMFILFMLISNKMINNYKK
jgi:hypothetical protein